MNKGLLSFIKADDTNISLNYKVLLPFYDDDQINEVSLAVSKTGMEFYPVLVDGNTVEFKSLVNDSIISLALVDGVLCVSSKQSLKLSIKNSKYIFGNRKETLRWEITSVDSSFRDFLTKNKFQYFEYTNVIMDQEPEKGCNEDPFSGLTNSSSTNTTTMVNDTSITCPASITNASQCNANPNSVWNSSGGSEGTGECVCCSTDGMKYIDVNTFTCLSCPTGGACGNSNGNCSGIVATNETCQRSSSGTWSAVCKDDAPCGGRCNGGGCDNWRFFAPQACGQDESGNFKCKFSPSFSGDTLWPTVVYYIFIPAFILLVFAILFWTYINWGDDSVTEITTTGVIPPGYRL